MKIIQHHTSVETRVLAFDHEPYSANTQNIPDEVVDAQKMGLGLWIPDFDARVIEWRDDVSHSN
jgi:hypothetical protein